MESSDERLLTGTEPYASIRRETIHLGLRHDTIETDNPVYIASSFPQFSKPYVNQKWLSSCCNQREIVSSTIESARSLLHSRLLYPIADVFCFIYNTLSDLGYIADELRRWIQLRKGIAIPFVLPEIVIIILGTGEDSRPTQVSSAFFQAFERISQEPLTDFFYGPQFLKIRKGDLPHKLYPKLLE